MFSLPITVGHAYMITLAYIPWVFLFFRRSFKNKKNMIPCAIFMVLVFFGGGVYNFLMLVLMMILYTLFVVIEKKSIKYLKIIGLIFLLTLGLGAIKFFPTMEYLKEYPRVWDSPVKMGYSMISLYKSLTLRDQSFPAFNKLRGSGEKSFINGSTHFMNENGMYIGYIPLILGLTGLLFTWGKNWKLFLIFLMFLWISFGSMASFSLWNLIHEFPLYSSLRVPQRSRVIFMLAFSIFCGIGLNKLYIKSLGFAKKKIVNGVFVVFIILITFNLILVNSKEFKHAFIIEPPLIEKEKIFIQHFQTEFEYGPYKQWHKEYLSFKQNKGTTNCFTDFGGEPIYQPNVAIPFEDARYIGEVFLFSQKIPMDILYWSPNSVAVKVSSKKDDYLVLNQNLIKGWKVKGSKDNKIELVKGLVATKVDKETTKVVFYYLPDSFIIGAIVSLLSLIGIIISYKRFFQN